MKTGEVVMVPMMIKEVREDGSVVGRIGIVGDDSTIIRVPEGACSPPSAGQTYYPGEIREGQFFDVKLQDWQIRLVKVLRYSEGGNVLFFVQGGNAAQALSEMDFRMAAQPA